MRTFVAMTLAAALLIPGIANTPNAKSLESGDPLVLAQNEKSKKQKVKAVEKKKDKGTTNTAPIGRPDSY